MKYLFIFLLSLPAWRTFAQTEREHNIDKQVQACLDKPEAQTTLGMIECAVWAGTEWDKELNRYYKLLMAVLSTEEKEKLRTAQRNWLVYRDSEINYSNTVYSNMEGTMWKIAAANRQTEITRKRALELQSYYEDLSEK